MKNSSKLTEKNSLNAIKERFNDLSKNTAGYQRDGRKGMQGSSRCFLSLVAGLLLFTASWLSPESAFTANSPPETLPVSIQASAQWEEIVRNEDGEELRKYSGFHRMMITGTMTLDRSGSPIIHRQGIMAMAVETYRPDNLTASSTYLEEVVDLRPQKYRSCDNPLIKRYQGSHFAPVTDGPPLVIQSYQSAAAPFMQNLSENERQYAAQLQAQFQKKKFPDFYQFAVGGGTPSKQAQEVTVRGIRSTGPPDCTFEDVEKSYPGFGIGLQIQLPQSGAMTGYRIWQADCDGCFPPDFGIQVSDMGKHGGEEPLSPAEGGKRNVTYTLSWCFGARPASTDTPDDEQEEEEEDPCEILKNRVNFISLVMAAYSNASIREYVDGQDYDLSTKKQMYQSAVENAVMDAINDNTDPSDQISAVADAQGENVTPYPESTETPVEGEDILDDGDDPLCQSEDLEEAQAQTNMNARASGNMDGSENIWGNPLGSVTIEDRCTGSPVTVEVYDGNGNAVYQDLHNPVACWQEKYGNEAGKSRFEASLNHERTHVDQYARLGPIQSIDDMAERELEAYQNEMNTLLEDMMELDCP
jgi:hypothetical protein